MVPPTVVAVESPSAVFLECTEVVPLVRAEALSVEVGMSVVRCVNVRDRERERERC